MKNFIDHQNVPEPDLSIEETHLDEVDDEIPPECVEAPIDFVPGGIGHPYSIPTREQIEEAKSEVGSLFFSKTHRFTKEKHNAKKTQKKKEP